MRQSMFFTAFLALFVLIAPQSQADDATAVTVANLTGVWKGTTVNGNITEHWVINRQRTGRFKASRLYIDHDRKVYARIMNHGTWSVVDGAFVLKVKFENDRSFTVNSLAADSVDYTNATTSVALKDTRTNAMILPAPPEGYKLVQRDALSSR